MDILKTRNLIVGILYRFLIVSFGLVIVLVSMARAGLEIIANENTGADTRNDEVNYYVRFDDGETMSGTYKLPETGMLADDPFYGIKKVREWLWMTFSSGKNKIKVALLLADKGMAEAKELVAKDKYDLAVETGNEAMDKLQYADKLINANKVADDQVKQIHYQMFWAGFAYKEIFIAPKEVLNYDLEKYTKLITRINDWNKEQEKKRFEWSY